ncbi:MAG: substrate-binding domain-containing protein [Firmicutes bacterium]|nr:substrate-binding domain-containing protein [Bacillota bacterium]
MKRTIAVMLVLVMAITALTGCGGANNDISVISREEGSGTRDAFVELMGIKVDGADNTTVNAEVSSSTSVVMTTVAGNENAIGYISMGSLNDTVKAIKVDGVEATAENVKNGSYKVARPFNIVTGKNLSDLAEDFMSFILSKDGQEIISEEGYIQINDSAPAYTKKSNLKGRIVLAGSTSVAPVMDVLADAYKQINPDVEIEIQQTGSGAGITSTIEGACDIGMSSRDLKSEETAKGVSQTKIAMDGIAVIVNLENPVEDLTAEQIRQIFTGEMTTWE